MTTSATETLKIYAVIVVYLPDLATLSAALAAVAPQVTKVLLLANDGVRPALVLPTNAELCIQERNLGLGAAYNLAAAWARANGATHLLLLDQDSVPAQDMAAILAGVFCGTSRIAAAGPLWRDPRTGKMSHFVRFTRWSATEGRATNHAIVPVDFLISSGTLISLEAIDRIGPFDELLFIEHVDTDWCLRARAMGYMLVGIAAARLDHSFGEATLTEPLVGGRRFFSYPAELTYYLVRNSIILWRRPYAPIEVGSCMTPYGQFHWFSCTSMFIRKKMLRASQWNGSSFGRP
jgi:rhamnosyltransferase